MDAASQPPTFLYGQSQVKLKSHQSLVTQKKQMHDLQEYGFRPKTVLRQRGALQKYFEGSTFSRNIEQQNKTWVNNFCGK